MKRKEKKADKKKKRPLYRKIINAFIITFLAVFLLLLLVLGFTQTSTFRELAREKAVEIVSESINGNFELGGIDGTIFTSLFLKDIKIYDDRDTLLSAKQIELKISPLQILLKRIYVRKIELDDVSFRIYEYEDGKTNLSKIFASSDTTTESSDSLSFPFKIDIAVLNLNNLDFRSQPIANAGKFTNYEKLNTGDLWVKDINLSASAAANINKKNIFLNLEKLSANPNISVFNLHNLSTKLTVTDKYVELNDFKIVTDSSDIGIYAKLDSIDVFDTIDPSYFRDYPAQIQLDASPFSFSDLSSFVEATEMLKGKVGVELDAEGTYANLNIKQLDVDYLDTDLNLSGQLENLHLPGALYMDVRMSDSRIVYDNIHVLMPGLELPEYKNVVLKDIELFMKGEATRFDAGLTAGLNKGSIDLNGTLNLEKSVMRYDANFVTEKLNIQPFTGMNSIINSDGHITGEGTDPSKMIAELKLALKNSTIDEYKIESLNLSANAQNSLVDLDIRSDVDSAKVDISGYIDFRDTTRTEYDITGATNNLNLAKFTKDDYFDSDLNLSFMLQGQGTELDSLVVDFNLEMENSVFRSEEIDHAGLALSVSRADTGRAIKLSSDFVDFNINGKFSIDTALTMLNYQSTIISDIVEQKLAGFNPISVDSIETVNLDSTDLPPIAYTDLNFNYDYQLKDFTLIALLLGEEQFDASGKGSGSVSNSGTIFAISSDFNLDYFIRRNGNDILYLSDVELNIDFNRDNKVRSFENLFGAVSVTGERIHFGQDINDLELDLIFNQAMLFYNFQAEYESDLKAALSGNVELSNDFQEINLSELSITYQDVEWASEHPARIMYNGDDFIISDFNIENGGAALNLEGVLRGNGEPDFNLTLSGFTGSHLSSLIRGNNINVFPDGEIWISSNLKGTLEEPEVKIDMEWRDLQYGSSVTGMLDGSINYVDRNLTANVDFYTTEGDADTLFTTDAELPIYLGTAEVENRIPEDGELDFKFIAENFDLALLGNSLPQIRNQSGHLTAKVNAHGTLDDLKYDGELNIEEGKLTGMFNGLDYDVNAKTTFDQDGVNVEYIRIKNGGEVEVENTGEMTASGKVVMDNLSITEMNFNVEGDLTVLSEDSRGANPNVYGNLFIGSDGKWTFDYTNNRPNFEGTILIKEMDLTYSPSQSAYSSSGDDFNFIYVVDSADVDKQRLKFEQLVEESKQEKESEENIEEEAPFDYRIGVKIVDEANLIFLLSRGSNQRLIAEISGNVEIISEDGVSRAQGGFQLLSGSKLEFIKTLEAEGNIKFESDLANPYLDIVATYVNDYESPPNYPNQTVEVAVKLKLQGTLDELGKNLAENPENISVYVGARNIQNNIADESYDASDALSFIIIGKFKEDLTPEDQTQVASNSNLIGSTASSLLGSVLSNFLNSALGDYIGNIEVTQTQYETKFSVSGKYERLRYSVGGSTDVFENLSRANLKLSYMFSNNIMIRLERKDPIIQTTGYEEKIDEVGLQYKFEF